MWLPTLIHSHLAAYLHPAAHSYLAAHWLQHLPACLPALPPAHLPLAHATLSLAIILALIALTLLTLTHAPHAPLPHPPPPPLPMPTLPASLAHATLTLAIILTLIFPGPNHNGPSMSYLPLHPPPHLHPQGPHTPISLIQLLHLLSLTTCCSSFTALPILCPEGSAFPANGSATTNGSYADQRDDGGDSDSQEDHDHDHEDSRASLHLHGVTMEEFDPTLEAGSTMCVGSVRKHRCRDRSRIMAKMKTHIWRSMTLSLSPTLSRSMTELSL